MLLLNISSNEGDVFVWDSELHMKTRHLVKFQRQMEDI